MEQGTVPVYVGLDYHRLSVQVCVVDASGRVLNNRKCGNSVADILACVPRGCGVRGAAIESCCGAADLGEELRDGPAWPLTLAHPGYVNRMKHNPDKSDYSDARMLAELSRAGFVPAVWLAPEWVRELRLLVRLRADLVARVRTVKTRILGVLRIQRIVEPGKPGRWSKGWVAWVRGTGEVSPAGRLVIDTHLEELESLAGRIKQTEARLEETTRDDAAVEHLRSIKGVGPVTAWTMRALIGDFTRFASGKQLSRFCALTPRNASSGEKVADSGLIKAGDPQLKTVLIEAAQRLRRYDERWKAFARQLEDRGKPGSVVVAAVANRWVRWLYHRVKEIGAVKNAA